MDYDNYNLSGKEKCICVITLIAALGVLGILFYKTAVFIILTPVLYRPVEKLYKSNRIEAGKKALLIQFRDFLYSISSPFASGRHMSQAMEEARDSLVAIYDVNSLIVRELDSMLTAIKSANQTDLQVLEDFSQRCQIEDIVSFVSVYKACRSTGGDINNAVIRSSEIIGEKIEIENQINTIYSQKKIEGGIILSMPFVLILFMNIVSPEYLSPMYQTLAGRFLMTLCIVIMICSYFAIRRITRIEI